MIRRSTLGPAVVAVGLLCGCGSEPAAERVAARTSALAVTQEAKLTAAADDPDGARGFPWSVAISGDTAVIGAYSQINSPGSAYVFVRSGGSWVQQARLVGSTVGDGFGKSISISGDTLVVGAPGGPMIDGAAYVYVRSGTTWSQQAKIPARPGDMFFGYSVGISDKTIVVGDPGALNPGAAYVFTSDGTAWSQQAKLVGNDVEPQDGYGISAAISGDTVIVGAWERYNWNDGFGAAYLFVRKSGAWSQQAMLTASDGEDNGYFGRSVGISGDTVAVGAPWAQNSKGAAYVFSRSGAIWAPHAVLAAKDSETLGFSVAVTDGLVVTGSLELAGAAHVFMASGSTWSEVAKLSASGTDFMGTTAAISGSTVIVGDNRMDYLLTSPPGAAYVFRLDQANLGDPCTIGTECKSTFCVDGVCCDTACGGNNTADCQACSLAAGASANGTCAQVTGTLCSDGNACTQDDICQAGACSPGAPLICGAPDQCHEPGTCNPLSGCSNHAKPDGVACNDGDACTQTDSCQAGTCTGTAPVICSPLDQCHEQGSCDPATGKCSGPSKADGVACDDGDACTQTDTCQAGTCTGASPILCTALDQCHKPGSCDPATGTCNTPLKPWGDGCDDGNPCTQTDVCQEGTCVGLHPVTCSPVDECHDVGTCQPASGICSAPAKNDGAPCTGGTCKAGTCEPSPDAGPDGEAGAAGSGGQPGAGGAAGSAGMGGSSNGGSAGSHTGGSAGSQTGGSAGSQTGGNAGSQTGGSAGSQTGGNAGASEDAGPTTDTSTADSGGCGCRTAPASSSPVTALIGIAIAAGLARRRRASR